MSYLVVRADGTNQVILSASEDDIIQEYSDKPECTVFCVYPTGTVEELTPSGDWIPVPEVTL